MPHRRNTSRDGPGAGRVVRARAGRSGHRAGRPEHRSWRPGHRTRGGNAIHIGTPCEPRRADAVKQVAGRRPNRELKGRPRSAPRAAVEAGAAPKRQHNNREAQRLSGNAHRHNARVAKPETRRERDIEKGRRAAGRPTGRVPGALVCRDGADEYRFGHRTEPERNRPGATTWCVYTYRSVVRRGPRRRWPRSWPEAARATPDGSSAARSSAVSSIGSSGGGAPGPTSSTTAQSHPPTLLEAASSSPTRRRCRRPARRRPPRRHRVRPTPRSPPG